MALSASAAIRDDGEKLAHAGPHRLGFEYDSLDELLATFTRLEAAGDRPHFTVDHGMTTSFYYTDPDGNSVELQVDNFGSWAKSIEFMRSAPEFAADPIGVRVDPRRLIQARDEGASPWEVHERAYAGEFVPEAGLDLRIPS